MFYYLSLLRYEFFPLNIFKYITFRAGMAAVTTFLICIIVGPWFIRKLREWGMGEKPVLGAGRGQVLGEELKSKHGTPTMGGLLLVIVVLLLATLFGAWEPSTAPTLLALLGAVTAVVAR